MFAYNQRALKFFEVLDYKELGEDRQDNLQIIGLRTSKLTQSTSKWLGR